MQQLLQPATLLRLGEHPGAQCGAVEPTVGLQDLHTEMRGNLRQRRAAGLHHPARGLIGIHGVDAQVDEMLRGGTLAAADAASQAEDPGFHSR